MEFEEEMEFKIVGSSEANSLQGKISNESPVGKALIGRSIGDVVEVETQAGVISSIKCSQIREKYTCKMQIMEGVRITVGRTEEQNRYRSRMSSSF